MYLKKYNVKLLFDDQYCEFCIYLIIVLAPGDVAEHTGVDTGSLYGGVFAGIIILAFAIIIIALIIR